MRGRGDEGGVGMRRGVGIRGGVGMRNAGMGHGLLLMSMDISQMC